MVRKMDNELNLVELLQLLKKNWWKILLCGIASLSLTFIITETMIRPKYQSTAKLVILNKANDVTITYSDIQISNQLVKDSMEIVTNREIMESVINELELPFSAGGLKSMISVSSPAGTRIVRLTVTDINPDRAADIADALFRYSSREIVTSLDANAVNLFEAPIASYSPVSPNLRNNCILGTFLGVALCVAVLIAAFMFDTKISTPEDIETKLKRTLLAAIPYNESNDISKKPKASAYKRKGVRKQA